MVDRGLLAQLTARPSGSMIDLVLSGDNAVGSGLALLARIAFAPVATKLLQVTGLLAGGPPAKSVASAVA